MQRQTHYRLPVSPRRRGGKVFWWLTLLILVGGGWAWWTSGNRRPPTSTKRPAPVIASQPSSAPRQDHAIVKSPPLTATKPAPTPTITNAAAADGAAPPPAPAAVPTIYPRPPRNTLETQIALTRLAISPGSIDGVDGPQTRAALAAFRSQIGGPVSGGPEATKPRLLELDSAPFTTYTVTSNDLARLQPLDKTWLGKSQQTALDYETVLELVAEKGHASPALIRQLNPTVNWTNVGIGTELQITAAEYPAPAKAAFATIRLAEKRLQVFDARTNLLAHFPCSIAAQVEKRPAGELHVTAIAPNPNYTFDPAVFPESAEARQIKTKLILPPGPNNPVGIAWISLDKPGYGMHGTPGPEQVGRTESHGCFRLANWNAEYLVKLAWVGMPVYVEP